MSTDDTRTTPIGDERELAIMNEASGVGLVAGIYACLTLAVVTAVLGHALLPFVLLLLTAVPSWTTMLWAKHRGVDLTVLAARTPAAYQLKVLAIGAVAILLTLAAMAWTLFTGHGLVELPTVAVAGPDASGWLPSLAKGAVIGGAGGVLIAIVAGVIAAARKR